MHVHLSRARVLAGLGIVLVGTVWATGGADAVRALGWWSVRVLPAAVFGLGVILLIRALAPRGLITGPLLLLVIGAAALALQFNKMPAVDVVRLLPLAVVIAGVFIALVPRRSPSVQSPNIERRLSFLTPRRVQFTGVAPAKLIIRSLFGGLHADLTSCTYPGGTTVLMVDVTQFAGRVELCLPRAWHVRAGRIELARAVRFAGELDSAEPPPGRTDGISNLVVVNVQGLRGSLTITRPQPVAAESGNTGPSAASAEPDPAPAPGSSAA